jgi:hypothetical protein
VILAQPASEPSASRTATRHSLPTRQLKGWLHVITTCQLCVGRQVIEGVRPDISPRSWVPKSIECSLQLRCQGKIAKRQPRNPV